MTINEFIGNELKNIGEIESEEQIAEITIKIKDKYNTKCDYFYAGDFDSPGYDLHCFVICWIGDDGELHGYDVQWEVY